MIEHSYADVNGVRLHYASAGNGDVVLFVHGFPEFWYAWRNQLLEFGKDYHAVAVDMRGYNLSSKPENVSQYAVEHLVADIGGLADQLGAEKIVLVGHDWGGVATWVFAARHPARVSRLISINSPHPAIFEREIKFNPAQQKASAYILAFKVPGAEHMLALGNYSALRKTLTEPLIETGHLTKIAEEAYLESWSQPGALKAALNYYRAASITDTAADLPQVAVPTLVIWGELDRYLTLGLLKGLEELVPGVRIERVPDATHWIVHERPELVNRLIREFLASPA